MLELDDRSNIICYEEYFPFGSHLLSGRRSQTDLPKRYRYTGKERDEENDLSYHGARYYAPWLGRWVSCDPAGIAAGLDSYLYAHANPVRLIDPGGMQPETPLELPEEIIYVQGTYDDLTSAIARGITRPEKSREQVAAELARERPYGDDPYSEAVQSVWDQDPVEANQQWQDYVTQKMAEEHAKALADLHQAYRRINAANTAVKIIGGGTLVGVGVIGAAAALTTYAGVAGTYSLATSANTAVTAVGGAGAAATVINDLEEAAPAVDAVAADVQAVEEESSTFYTVQNAADAARLRAGGAPWPTEPSRAALGEGVYAFGEQAGAQAYQNALTSQGASGLEIVPFEVSAGDLASMRSLNIDLLPDAEAFLGKFSQLWGGTPDHGYDLLMRGTQFGTEHFFSKSVYDLLNFLGGR